MSPAPRLAVAVIIAIVFADCLHCASLPRSYDPRLGDDVVMSPKKRPFCNSFTGCGRKRSDESFKQREMVRMFPQTQELLKRQYLEDDTLGSLLEPENSIDDLSKQILSEAKLWEAMQEAGAEMNRRRQKEMFN